MDRCKCKMSFSQYIKFHRAYRLINAFLIESMVRMTLPATFKQ